MGQNRTDHNAPAPGSHQVLLSIIIPCLNEEGNIQELTERITSVLQHQPYEWEVVLIDDGSRDQTWNKIEDACRGDARFKAARHSTNQGIVAGWSTGMELATGEWVLTMDADLQNAPEEIPQFIEEMRTTGSDIVQGVRKHRLDQSNYRNFLSKTFSKLLQMIFHLPLDDLKSGFVLYRKECFAEILKSGHSFRLLQHWIMIAGHAKGFKIFQIPTTFYPRKSGTSSITSPVKFSLKVLLELPKAILHFRTSGR